tara:strand:- start:221 stop:685 length:465 start_codon:yes stop_codon:yes gene_type:complete
MVKIISSLKLKQPTIYGLKIIPLKEISDERGSVLHMLRSDSENFQQFGEIYFSEINPGYIKTWKKHLKMTQNFTVPIGKVLFKFYDDRSDSKSFGNKEKFFVGRPDNYYLIIVPPLIWYSFENTLDKHSLIANCSSIPHDHNETIEEKLDFLDF